MRQQKTNLPRISHTAEPIRDQRDLERIRSMLVNKPRDLLLFDLVTETGVPVKQLLWLKVKDLSRSKVGDRLIIPGSGFKPVLINQTVHKTLQKYVREIGPSEDEYLFKSRKGAKPLTLSSVSRMVKGWFKAANLRGLSGVLSLRRTWDLHHRDPSRSRAQEHTGDDRGHMLKPVQVFTVQETVLGELEQAILSGQIAPGQRLVAEDIARQMHVSRIPVREALAKLEARGFITGQRKGGSVVKELSKENLEEVLEIRLILETMAARIATLRCSKESLEHLEDIYQQLAKATARQDVDETLRLNKEFHHTIYREADKPILQQMIEISWDKISPYFHILMRQVEDYDKAYDTELHRRILNGMRRRNPEEVCKWLRADMTQAVKLVSGMFGRSKKS